MGLWILEPSISEHVPGILETFINGEHETHRLSGTSFVLDDASRDVEGNSALKYDHSGPIPIILVPQPSDDPNDPLVHLYYTRAKYS